MGMQVLPIILRNPIISLAHIGMVPLEVLCGKTPSRGTIGPLRTPADTATPAGYWGPTSPKRRMPLLLLA